MTTSELKAWRVRLGFSKILMAEYLGFSIGGYIKLEQGQRLIQPQLQRTVDILQLVEAIAPSIAEQLIPVK